MAKPFDPRKTLKHINNMLLREFFTRRGELEDVPWDDLTEHKIEPVFEAWQSLTDEKEREVQVVLRDIHDLSDHRGLAVLTEEILCRSPDHADEFAAQESMADKAMWVLLNVPDAFTEASMFAHADALAAGRYWVKRNGLPKETITVTDGMKQDLASAMTGFYGPQQLRGRQCEIVSYVRTSNSVYFFAYLDDYPDKRVVFDDAGHRVVSSERYAFENFFVYSSDDGTMEVFAPGGKKVWEPLQAVFCKAVLGLDIEPADPLRPSFLLDHLLAPDFPLPTDPRDQAEEARITRLRIAPRGSGGYVEIKADRKAHPNDIYRKIERWLKSEILSVKGVRITQATFSLKFAHDGTGRQPTLTFDVSAPHSSNLKSKPDHYRAVGERCLKLWGVVDDKG